MIQKVKEFMERQNSWFELSDESDNSVSYTTRLHGDVGEETPGDEDCHEAGRLGRVLKDEFKDKIIVQLESIDEWVDVGIYLKKEVA
jgi:hypothetical protein